MPLFPKAIDVYEMLDSAFDNLSRAVAVLVDLMHNFENVENKIMTVYELERPATCLPTRL